jgi:hypothetical protein
MNRTSRLWLTACIALAIAAAGMATLSGLGADWTNLAHSSECISSSWSGQGHAACQLVVLSIVQWADTVAVTRWLWVDNAFVVAYLLAFWLIAAAAISTLFAGRAAALRGVMLASVVALALACGLWDLKENFQALGMLGAGHASSLDPEVESLANLTVLKWRFFGLAAVATLVLVLMAAIAKIVRMAKTRRNSPPLENSAS